MYFDWLAHSAAVGHLKLAAFRTASSIAKRCHKFEVATRDQVSAGDRGANILVNQHNVYIYMYKYFDMHVT